MNSASWVVDQTTRQRMQHPVNDLKADLAGRRRPRYSFTVVTV
jgi:hypothetical protein